MSIQAVSGQPTTVADQIEGIGPALTAEQLADILVSKITVFNQAKAGRIPCFHVGTCVRFDPRAVANWLRNQWRAVQSMLGPNSPSIAKTTQTATCCAA